MSININWRQFSHEITITICLTWIRLSQPAKFHKFLKEAADIIIVSNINFSILRAKRYTKYKWCLSLAKWITLSFYSHFHVFSFLLRYFLNKGISSFLNFEDFLLTISKCNFLHVPIKKKFGWRSKVTRVIFAIIWREKLGLYFEIAKFDFRQIEIYWN